jgi:tight adherence protein B
MSGYILYLSVFVGAVLLFELVAVTISASRERAGAINRRLKLMQTMPRGDQVLSMLRQERSTEGPAALRWARRLYVQSGMTIGPLQLFAFTGAAGFVLATATGFLSGNSIYAGSIFVAAVVGAPLLILKRMRGNRVTTFSRQLPNAIDIIVRSLRAGHPMTTAIAMVGREMRDPIGTEFGMLSDELTYGLQFDDAMRNLVERVGADDLRLVATTLNVQRSTGGNLAEILQNLSVVIRQRFQMRAKIRAISAEGRITAYIMSAFPILIYLVLTLIRPSYYDAFWESPIAGTVVSVCVFLLVVGDIIIFRMVNFDF